MSPSRYNHVSKHTSRRPAQTTNLSRERPRQTRDALFYAPLSNDTTRNNYRNPPQYDKKCIQIWSDRCAPTTFSSGARKFRDYRKAALLTVRKRAVSEIGSSISA